MVTPDVAALSYPRSMATTPNGPLPPAPDDVLDPSGRLRYGTYAGAFRRVELARMRAGGFVSKLRSLATRKHWTYGFIATQEVACGFAVVDLGYASNAFVFITDLQGALLSDESFLGIPGVSASVEDPSAEGSGARFSGSGANFSIRRPIGSSRWRVELATPKVRFEGELESADAPPALAAILPLVNGGEVDCTMKATLLPATGRLTVSGRDFTLDGGYGGLDYTQGIMARHTAWRWAFALGRAHDGTPVSLNLTDGLSSAPRDANENALWVGASLQLVGAPRFEWNPQDPMKPWRLATSDGAVELAFTPHGKHFELKRLGLVSSDFLQVAGTFEGRLTAPDGRVLDVRGLPGVTEDQRVTW